MNKSLLFAIILGGAVFAHAEEDAEPAAYALAGALTLESVTNLDGGDAEPAGLEHDADAARGHALAEAAHHPSCHQHVLHGGSSN